MTLPMSPSQVECGDLTLCGAVMGCSPVLTAVGGVKCGLMTLCGNLVVTKGEGVADVVNALQGVTEVCGCGLRSLGVAYTTHSSFPRSPCMVTTWLPRLRLRPLCPPQ